MKAKTKSLLQAAALFCIYLMVNFSVVHALTLSHNPDSDVTVTGTQAEIRWTTDEPADSVVDYGESTGLGSSESESDSVIDHLITLTGLGLATTYYYKLTSSTAGETAVLNNSGSLYSFTTVASTDTTPPQFNVSLPEYYNRMQITFGGYTDPDSILKLYVNADQADIGTESYTQLTTSDSSGHFIFKYITLQTENTLAIWAKDPGGNTNTETFTLNVDTERPVVTITEPPVLAASTSVSINGTVSEDVTVTYTIGDDIETEEFTAGSFNLQLSLEEGAKNLVDIQFSDKAGNVVEKEFTISVDTQGPSILWHNLDSLDPSYIQDIVVRGNVTKPGAIVAVFVNNKTYSSQSWSTSMKDMLIHYGTLLVEGDREYTAVADKAGNFKIEVFLTQEIETQKSGYSQDPFQTSPGYNQGNYPGQQYPGQQPVVPGGTPTTYGTGPGIMPRVTTGSTGRYSNAWDNNIKIVVFDELGREDTREGVVTFARCGFGSDWNVEIKDPTPSVITPEHLRQGIAQIAFGVNLKWQGPGDPENRSNYRMLMEPVVQQYILSDDVRQNYAFDPNELVSGVHPLWDPDRRTKGYVVLELHKKDYEQKNLSDMEKEDLFIKLPLQIEIQYEYVDTTGQMVTSVQKQCWDVSVALDVKIPTSVIPKELLNASVMFINKTITAINMILKPLKTITIAVFVTCLLSWVMYFFVLMKKAYDCMGQKEGEKDQPCLESVSDAKKVERYMHLICDRIFCPSVPTADFYFRDMSPTEECKTGLTPAMDKNDGKCGEEYVQQWGAGCLLMDELKRSKCLRYQAGDAQFSESCGESGQMLKNIWYGASDFCRKKDKNTARRVSVTRDGKAEEWIIDDDGTAHRSSSVTETKIEKKDGKYVDVGKGGATSRYETVPLGQYTDADGVHDNDIAYDEEGRLYYPTGKGEEDRQYLCNDAQTGKLRKIDRSERGGVFNSQKCEGRRPATLPPEIISAANMPSARKYIVDPTDNLLTALQCVCLPAINGFLTMWRNMLGAIMQCFQSILITGDGSSGLCRAVLTQYLCDIVISAIRCFVNKFGVGSGGRVGERGGISNFFKSAATAGGDVQKAVTGRYGESAMYKTMFSEKKLIHAACLWAFTGDFDFDIESALTGAGAIPLNSKAFLYPRTRRFMGSNPLTGYATHIYHIGAGLVAGADISYKLQLVCSNTDGCDVQAGFLNGLCDCYHENREYVRDITYSFGPGRLDAGEMLGPNEGNIYVKIDSEKYRYDKVRLTYNYVDNSGNPTTKVTEGKITQIGGKPPADCSFDLAGGAFRCAYEIGDLGYAVFTEIPSPEQNIYGLGETIYLDFKVDKRSPDSQRADSQRGSRASTSIVSYDSVPFYLRYEVTTPSGSTAEPQVLPIIPDGVKDFSGSIPNIKITEDVLMSGAVSDSYDVMQSYKPKGAEKIINPSGMDSKSAETEESFAVYVKETTTKKNPTKEERKFQVKVCRGEVTEEIKSGEIKYGFKVYTDCTTTKSGYEDTAGDLEFESQPLREIVQIVYKGIKMRIRYSNIQKKWGGFVMRYRYSETYDTGSLDCITKFTTARPAIFTIKIGLYPCLKRDPDQPRTISNCEPDMTPVNYFGAVQEHTIEAKATCSEGTGKGGPRRCMIGVYESEPCECRQELVGRNNCGEGEETYCYFAVRDYKCKQYMSCRKDVPTDSSSAEEIDGRLYCDCDGDYRMEDCSGKFCYQKGGKWDCYPDPPQVS